MSWRISPQYKDPDYSSVSLLLHGNGTNGSTTITDNSSSPKTVTAVGNAQISTAIADPFGNSTKGVIAFDGTEDRLTTSSNITFALGTADFTVEAWINEFSRKRFATLLEIDSHLSTGIAFLTSGGANTDNRIGMYSQNSGGFVGSAVAGPLNEWNHVAYVRQSGTFTCYVNGAGGSPVSFVFNHTDTATVTVGSIAGGSSTYDFNGYIDDFRITKGVARYTANFSVPPAPFPDI
jgi:hypothetical protein